MDLIMVGKDTDLIKKERQEIEYVSDKLLQKSHDIAEKVGVEFSVPRITQKQIHRSNAPSVTAIEYWRRLLIIPDLESLTSSYHTSAFTLYFKKFGKKCKVFHGVLWVGWYQYHN